MFTLDAKLGSEGYNDSIVNGKKMKTPTWKTELMNVSQMRTQ